MKLNRIYALKIFLAIMFLTFAGCTDNSEEILNKLNSFTTINNEGEKYEFSFLNEFEIGNKDGWVISYTKENTAVIFYDASIKSIFTDIFGENCFYSYDTDYVAYDFDENEFHVYLNEEVTDFSSITYNLNDEEFTGIHDGKHYYLSTEFLNYLDDSYYVALVRNEIDAFKTDLEKHNLTIDDVANLNYSDI